MRINDKIYDIKVNIIGVNNMKIDYVEISDIGPIKNLNLSFNSGLNVICGTNGIGKTTILESISSVFSSSGFRANVKKRYNAKKNGLIKLNFADGSKADVEINKYHPFEQMVGSGTTPQKSIELFYFTTKRNIEYVTTNNLSRDFKRDYLAAADVAQEGITGSDIKNWFITRYLVSGRPDMLSEVEMNNFELAISMFSKVDNLIKFSKVDHKSFEILLKDKENEVYFEYLSSGYKTCLFLLLGIIKEIEYRFYDPIISAVDFDGVILIDEIDMHLHPTWQAKLVECLKECFPSAQFIVTTHSPHVIQTLLPSEIIALDSSIENGTFKKELFLGDYGLQGWTVEEILGDIMGMTQTQTPILQKTMEQFELALQEENVKKLNECYDILDNLLHPKNPLRKIYSIQMAGWRQ